jgi:hypothetical protein
MRELIDELGALEAELAPVLAVIKPKTERVKWLKDQISEQTPAGQQAVQGLVYGASVNEAANERTITSMPRLFRTIGQGEFLSRCGFPLGEFDKLVKSGQITASEKAVLLKEENTGSRKITTFLLPTKAA